MELWIVSGFVVLILMLVILLKRKGNTTVNRNKSIFISGCDSGIGYKLATHLDSLGCTVYAGCLEPDGEGAKLLREETSDRLKIISLDITKQESIDDAVKSVKDDLNGKDLWALVNNAGVCVCGEFDWLTTNQCLWQLNVNLYGTIAVTKTFLPLIRQSKDLWALINNAGVCIYGEFDWLTHKQCRQQLDVNLYGTISMTKAFLPLVRQSKGRIINITSVNAQCAYPGLSVYCATKFALEGFSDVLRLELAKFGIRVIIIQPGDFARLTHIMNNHQHHMKEMWDNMEEQDKIVYGDYFQKYHRLVLKNIGLSCPPTFASTSLLTDVQEALFSSTPSPRYVVASLPFKIFFFLVRVVPTRWTDSLMLYVMKRIFDGEAKKRDV